ncbi:hypothetical protein [Nocardia alni]|uniref:hypothetical protein n=1 Tax=Nocardia alni TaxID=2815723 RepID=UPI001C213F29|nr:hypothetical protein [Nocardia alni]
MTYIEPIIGKVLDEGRDDWVMIDQLVWYAKQTSEEQGRDLEQVTTDLLNFLLAHDLVVVGELGDPFQRWDGSPAELVSKVVAALKSFDWIPQGATEIWLANTKNGDSWGAHSQG